MRRLLLNLILLCCFGIAQSQTVFNPNDGVFTYNSGATPGSSTNPNQPGGYDIRAWVRTPRVAWNSNRYKCYIIGNIPFRLRYPDSYVPGANDGKKYPVILFFHGGGEATTDIHDNEFQLFNGGYTFQDKILYGPQDAFILFPQAKYVQWDDSYYTPMNIVIDELVRNCKADADRVITMGLSIGGFGCLDYAVRYPQRAASVIASSPVFAQSLNYAPAVHVPLWVANGGNDNNPTPAIFQSFINYYKPTGGNLFWSFFPAQYHNTWDWQWGEEPNFGNTWATAHKANPMVYFNNRFFCPGSPVSSRMGITGGFYAYQWDKNGVLLPGATGNEYIATDFGTYRARFKRTAAADWSAWSMVPAVVVPICPPLTGNGTGLKGTYFNNTDLAGGAAYTRTDPSMNFIWEAISPAPGVATNHYSVRWTGKIQSQFSETHTIYTKSDEGIRLWINGVLLVNNYVGHAPFENSANFTFVAGQKYDIKIEYFNINDAGQAILKWSGPSTVKQVVPTTQLYPEGTGDPDGTLFCTTNLTPANGAVLSATATTLAWTAAANATSYDLYLWTGSTPPATPTANVASTSYNASGLIAGAAYNWYVVPKNASTAATGCGTTSKTTFSVSGTLPACITNTSPAAGTTLATQTSVTLTWPSSANAVSYDVYLAAGTGTPTTLITNTAALTYTYNSLNAGTTYSWYIAPRNASGVNTACAPGNVTTFTTAAATVPVPPPCVTNTAPVNNSTLTTLTAASLSWNSTATATSYNVYIWPASGSVPGTPTINVTGTTYDTTGLIAGTTYKFYVAPRNASGAATGCAASNTTTFTTALVATLAPCVTNTLPVSGAVLPSQTSARLTWPASSGATSYDVYLSAGNAVPTVLRTNTTALTYYATGLTAGTLYSWYIAPRNANGANTDCGYSNRTTFSTAVATGGGNLAPVANGGTNITITLPVSTTTLNGTASYDPDGSIAEYYWYQIQGPVTASITNFTGTPAVSGLTTAGNYVIGLQVKDNNGVTAYSQVTITVNPVGTPTIPACVTNTSPAAGTTLTTQNTATLSWPSSPTATSYDVYLAAGTGTPTVLRTNTAALTYSVSGLTAGTLYSWYIAPRNAVGVNTACATTNTTTFTTAAAIPAPPCVSNTAPLNNSTLTSQTAATLSWNSTATAISYDLYIWPASGSAPGTPTKNIATGTSYDTTGLTAGTAYKFYAAPRNASGAATGCAASNTFTFTTAAAAVPAPPCVSNTAPLNNSTLTSQTTATLSWNGTATATSYDLYIWPASGSAPGTPTKNVATGTSYDTTGLTAGTTYKFYAAPRNASGAATGCAASNTFTFTTAAAAVPAPPCVSNTAPLNNSTLSSQTTATLSWNGTATATSYDLYIWPASGSAPGTPTVNVATGTSYDTTSLIAGTTYKFYAAPRNAGGAANGCATNNTTTFTTAIGIPVPACVSNTAPLDNSTLPSQTAATLSWNSEPTATSYDLYIWPASGSAPGTPTINVTTGTSYDTTGLLAGTAYKFYVAPRNAGGAATGCAASNTFMFTTATPPVPACVTNASPLDNSTLPSQTAATLSWNSEPTATSYDLYIWPASGSAPGTPTINVTTGTSYDTTGLIAGTAYKFYVAPRNAGGAANGCATNNTTTFTTAIGIPVPACVSNTAPLDNSTLPSQTAATLSWNSEATATSYDLYIWLASGSAPVTPTRNVPGTTYDTTSLLAGTAYKFYVAPRNASGAATGCAAANTFTFTTAAAPVPPCISNTAPLDNSTLPSQTAATLSWNSTATATSYDLYIWPASGSAPGTPTKNVATGNSYDTTGLLSGTAYKFYVAPRNASGAATGCAASNTTTFITAAAPALAPCVINASPSNGTTLATQNTATLTWPSSPTTTSYDVYLAAGTGTPTVLITTTAALTYNAINLTANTTYSWYVAPKNAGGVNTACGTSNTTTFTTAAAPALAPCVINTSPATGTTLPSQTSARLNWPASAGATSYDVYLAAGNAVPTVLRTNTTALTYYATGLTAGTLYSWYIAPRNANGANTACGSTNRTTFTTATATGGGNLAPVANGGTNITITLPVSTTTLNGTASYDPDGSIAEYYWYQIQGPVTASITNFTGTPAVSGLTTAGTYVIGLQVKDNNGVPAYSQVTVTVKAAGTLVADAGTNLRVAATPDPVSASVVSSVPSLTSTVSPNPVKPGQSARVQISSDKTGSAAVNIVNSNGYIISTQKVNLVPGSNTTTVNTSALGQGLYIINITGGDKPINIKLLVE